MTRLLAEVPVSDPNVDTWLDVCKSGQQVIHGKCPVVTAVVVEQAPRSYVHLLAASLRESKHVPLRFARAHSTLRG